MKPAFSTVACPDWTLDHVAARAETWGYMGAELRTFGYGSTEIACDPALTAPDKVRSLFDRAGVELAVLATGIRYDEPVTPPVVGHILGNTESGVPESKGAIDLASRLACPFVRVFAYEIVADEPRRYAIDRIAERVGKATDAARNSGTRILLENGGSFATAAELAEILDACDNPLLSIAYNAAVANAAGESTTNGINVLGEKLAVVRLMDYAGGKPCALGKGDMRCKESFEALAKAGFGGWVVYEYPRLWMRDLPDAEGVLASSAKTMYDWMGRKMVRPPREFAVR